MFEVVAGVVVFTVLCLSIKALRLYGVFGLSVLAVLYPVAVLVLVFIGGAVYLLFFHRST